MPSTGPSKIREAGSTNACFRSAASLPFGATLARDPRQGLARGLAPFDPAYAIPRRNEGERGHNKTQPKPRIAYAERRGQAAGAAPTLRYGPAGDTAPRLRLRRLVWPKGSLPARTPAEKPKPPFPLVNSSPSDRPGAVQGAKRRSGPLTARTDLGIMRGEGKGASAQSMLETISNPHFERFGGRRIEVSNDVRVTSSQDNTRSEAHQHTRAKD